MPDFPINLRLEDRLCVVVGGGPVGRRKVQALLAAGARVRLIEPRPGQAPEHGLELVNRPYRPGDLRGACLVFAAAERDVNAAVVREARAAGIPVNVADSPDEGDFTLPAVLHRGDLMVAISTAGRSPAMAAVVRNHLAEILGPEWAMALEIAAALREKKLTASNQTEYNQEILLRLLEGGLLPLIGGCRTAEIDRLLARTCGDGHSLADLGIRFPKGKT